MPISSKSPGADACRDRLQRHLKLVGPFVGVALFILAIVILYRSLHEIHSADLRRAWELTPVFSICVAVAAATASYLALIGEEALAWSFARKQMARARVALASFIASAFSNNLGFGFLSGVPVRFHLYSASGVTAVEITGVIAFTALSFFLGLGTVAGSAFLLLPAAIPANFRAFLVPAPYVGVALLLVVVSYLGWSTGHRRRPRLFGWEVPIPPIYYSLGQVLISSADWLAAAVCFYCLLPTSGNISFVEILQIFMLAQFAGMASSVPGGIGVFEATALSLLADRLPKASILGALLLFRAIYYWLPLKLGCTSARGYWADQRMAW